MEILEKIPITKFSLSVAIVSFIVVFVIIVILGMFLEYKVHLEAGAFLGILCGILIGLTVSAFLSENVFPEETGKYRYKVKIDGTVSALEFNEKYTIINKESDNIFICESNYEDNKDEVNLEDNTKNTE